MPDDSSVPTTTEAPLPESTTTTTTATETTIPEPPDEDPEEPTETTSAPDTTSGPETSAPDTTAGPDTSGPETSGPETTAGPETTVEEVPALRPITEAVAVQFRAADPGSYSAFNLMQADSKSTVGALSAGRFECFSTVVYFATITAAADADGVGTVSLTTRFDGRFSVAPEEGFGAVGFTSVQAFLPTTSSWDRDRDSQYVSVGDVAESLSGAQANSWFERDYIELVTTVSGIEAGETIVVEYRATLGCEDDRMSLTGGVLGAELSSASVAGDGQGAAVGPTPQTVLLHADAFAGRDCRIVEPPEGSDLPGTIPEGCEMMTTFRAVLPGLVDNPPLNATCGNLKVMVVVDRSGSIQTAGAVPNVRTALNTLFSTLNNTGSVVGVVDFSTTASYPIPYQLLNDSSYSTFNNYANGLTADGFTNWDDAFRVTYNNLGNADLVLFITDGAPNRVWSSAAQPSVTATAAVATAAAAVRSDQIKSAGTKIFGVGVGAISSGAGNIGRLQAVTGDQQGSNVQSHDYVLVSNFADLANSLRQLVVGLCGSSITINKYVDGALAPGWDFTATVTAVSNGGPNFQWRNPDNNATVGQASASRTVTTGALGTANVQWRLGTAANPLPGTATVSLTEAVQPGYRFLNGTCTVDSDLAGSRTVNFTTLPVNLGAIQHDALVTCTVNNQQLKTPELPEVISGECVAGVATQTQVVVASTPAGATYTLDPAGSPPGFYNTPQDVLVTATLPSPNGGAWALSLPSEWTRVSDTVATTTLQLPAIPCTPATPVAPTVIPAACVDGVMNPADHTINVASTTGIEYTLNPPGPTYPGGTEQTVTVTATALPGYTIPSTPGWSGSGSSATTTVELPAVSCDEVSPALPTVAQAECVGGVVTLPTLTLPANTAAIGYSRNANPPYAQGQTVVVTATLLTDGVAWPAQADMPAGWTIATPTTATYSVTFDSGISCDEVSPALPTVAQAECVGGVVTLPTLTLPANTAAIGYSRNANPPYAQGQTVVVTATLLTDGVAWPAQADMPAGWTIATPTTATYSVTFDSGISCDEVSPALPTVAQAECVGGVVTLPTLTLPANTAAIGYSRNANPPYAQGQTVVVTATLLTDGVAWPAQADMPAGWTIATPTTATYSVTFDSGISCDEVSPALPTVAQAECVGGVVTLPTLTLPANTAAIGYSRNANPPYAQGQTVVVTATLLTDGVAWPAQADMPAGWTIATPTTATYSVTFDSGISCDEVSPALPTVAQAECVGGVVTLPTLTLPANTAAIGYSRNANPPYAQGQTVVVTATLLTDGVAWPAQADMPAGWTIATPTTATYSVTFDDDIACFTMVKNVVPSSVAATGWTLSTAPATAQWGGQDGLAFGAWEQVTAGDYTLSEAGPGAADGWDASAWTCTNDGQDITLTGNSVAVPEGGVVRCEITNSRRPTLTLVKETQPVGFHYDFVLTAAPTAGAPLLWGDPNEDDGWNDFGTFVTVAPDTFTLSEKLVDEDGLGDWAAGPWSCTEAGQDFAGQTGASVTLGYGNNVTCRIVNTDTADVSFVKTIDGEPTFTADGFEITYTIVVSNVTPAAEGTYTLEDDLTDVGSGVVVEAAEVVSTDVDGEAGWRGATWDGGVGLLDPASTLVAEGITIAPNATHTFTVTVSGRLDTDRLTPGSAACDPNDPQPGEGLFNQALLYIGDSDLPIVDEACAPTPLMDVAKSVVGDPVFTADGFSVVYEIVVTNSGGGAGRYDVEDTLGFPAGVTVTPPLVVVADPASIVLTAGWDGDAQPEIASDVLIAGAADPADVGTHVVHTYTITVTGTVGDGFEPGAAACEAGEPEHGLFNAVELTWGGGGDDDDACAPLPSVTVAKSVSSDPVVGVDGSFTVGYTITVTNTGLAGSLYDLEDTLGFPAGVTVTPPLVVVADPASIVLTAGWDGDAQPVIATGVEIDGAVLVDDAVVPVVHTYTITVTGTIDDALFDSGDADCVTGQPGNGLFNAVELTWGGGGDDDDACADLPALSVAKSVVGDPVFTADGFSVVYEIVVTNSGGGAGRYDVEDTLGFPAGVTVTPPLVVVADPASIVLTAGWDGDAQPEIASDVLIAGAADPADVGTHVVHTYTITVTGTVGDGFEPGAAACEAGEPEHGLFNAVELTWGGGGDDDDACAPLPSVTVAKSVSSDPVVGVDGSFTVGYTITVTNTGLAGSLYDLEDTLGFPAGVTVTPPLVVVADPASIVLTAGWDGDAQPVIATGVEIDGAVLVDDAVVPVVHTYTITVTGTIDDALFDSGDADCVTGQPGNGLFNAVELTWGGGGDDDDACADLPALSVAKSVVGDPVFTGSPTRSVGE